MDYAKQNNSEKDLFAEYENTTNKMKQIYRYREQMVVSHRRSGLGVGEMGQRDHVVQTSRYKLNKS